MRTRQNVLVIVAALGCAAEVGPIEQGSVTAAPRLYTATGEPVIGRLKTVEGVTDLTVSAFGTDARVPRDAWAKRRAGRRGGPIATDAVLGAEVDRSLIIKPKIDASLGLPEH